MRRTKACGGRCRATDPEDDLRAILDAVDDLLGRIGRFRDAHGPAALRAAFGDDADPIARDLSGLAWAAGNAHSGIDCMLVPDLTRTPVEAN